MRLGDNENFQTPDWVIEVIKKEIPCNIETILEPTPGNGNIVSALKTNFKIIYPKGDYFKMNHDIAKYDCIIGNPPFSPMKKGYDILYDIMNKTDLIIMVMPWLTLINGEKRLKDITEYGLKKIIHLPRSAFKGSRVQTCIIIMEKGHIRETVFQAISNPKTRIKSGK